MKMPQFVVVTAVVLLATGSVLAVMNNACKTSYHQWCAPSTQFHHQTIGRGRVGGALPVSGFSRTRATATPLWVHSSAGLGSSIAEIPTDAPNGGVADSLDEAKAAFRAAWEGAG